MMALSSKIDIWLTSLSDIRDDLLPRYESLLDLAERHRLRRYISADARRQFLVGRALLRTVLSNYAGLPPDAWSFSTNVYGKPRISVPEEFCNMKFNVSHTDGLVACAVGFGVEVGVDVEHTRRKNDIHDLAPLALGQCEMASLERLPRSARQKRFYALWTLKEAYLKATGNGLSIPLKAIRFDLDRRVHQIGFSSDLDDAHGHWQFRLMDPTPDHLLALAVAAGTDHPVSIDVQWVVPAAAR